MASKTTRLVIGFGEVYFEPFLPGTMTGEGEIYIGNTPDFSVTTDVVTQPVKDSIRGQLIELEAEVLQETHTVRFTTDDVELDNVGLWFGALPARGSDAPLAGYAETIRIKRGRHYQLGVSAAHPTGLRGISPLSATIAGVPVWMGNFELDAYSGRLHVPADAALSDGTDVVFTYDTAWTATAVVKSVSRELWGSLRFLATNEVGPRKSWFYPAVRLKASGETALKGDVWQAWAFEGEARKRSPAYEYVYIEENVPDLAGDLFIFAFDYGTFPFYEDILNTTINFTMPSRGYPS